MQITAINTTIMFIDDETKHQHHKSKVLTAPEITPVSTAKAEDKPQLKEPLNQDKVEIKKPEVKCEGDECKKD